MISWWSGSKQSFFVPTVRALLCVTAGIVGGSTFSTDQSDPQLQLCFSALTPPPRVHVFKSWLRLRVVRKFTFWYLKHPSQIWGHYCRFSPPRTIKSLHSFQFMSYVILNENKCILCCKVDFFLHPSLKRGAYLNFCCQYDFNVEIYYYPYTLPPI